MTDALPDGQPPEPALVAWSVVSHLPNEDPFGVFGLFATEPEAMRALTELKSTEALARPSLRMSFSVTPVYAATPASLSLLQDQIVGRKCRMLSCPSYVGPHGFEGYCERCSYGGWKPWRRKRSTSESNMVTR